MKKVINVGFNLTQVLSNSERSLQKQVKPFNEIVIEYAKENGLIYEMFCDETNIYDYISLNWPKEHEENVMNLYLEDLKALSNLESEVVRLFKVLKHSKLYDFKIFIFTSKIHDFFFLRDDIEYLLESKGIFYDKLVTRSEDKVKACLENDIHYFLGNLPETCNDISGKGITTCIMDCMSDIEFVDENVKVVNTLQEYVDYILSDLEEKGINNLAFYTHHIYFKDTEDGVITASKYKGIHMTSVYIEEGITKIEEAAFEGCFIEDVYFPKSLKYIGDKAFKGNDISYLKFGGNVEYIGEYAFYDCGVESFVGISKNLEEFKKGVFEKNCLSGLLYVSDDKLKEICSRAFANNDLFAPPIIVDSSCKIADDAFADNPFEF